MCPRSVAVAAAVLLACGGGSRSAGGVSADAPPPPSGPPVVILSLAPATVGAWENATLTWTADGATTCTASGSWSGDRPSAGTETATQPAAGTYTYELACTGAGGSGRAAAQLAVTAPDPGRVAVPAPGVVVSCAGTCYWVDAASGADTNDGRSQGKAFRTLARAADAVGPGSTVLVMSGTYTSDGTANPLTIAKSGNPDAWITFAAAPGQHPVIQIPRGPGATAGIHLPGASYVVIDGFEVVGQNGSITAEEAAANDGSQAVLNQNCVYIDGMGFGDVHPPIPHDIVIRNSKLHGCSAAGIEANVADALTIAYNEIYDTSWWTVFGTSGVGLYHLTDAPGSTTVAGYRNYVVGNLVHGNRNNMPFLAGHPPALYDGNGIIVDDSNHAQPAVGPWDVQGVPYAGRTYVANNVVYGNGGRGIHVYSSAHVDLVNNTLYRDLLTDSPFIEKGEIDGLSSNDVNVVNDVAEGVDGKPVVTPDGARYSYNVWAGSDVPFRGEHDLAAPLQLADPAGGDFSPSSASPAVGSATTQLAPTLDFFGRRRGSGPLDRGAIQVSR